MIRPYHVATVVAESMNICSSASAQVTIGTVGNAGNGTRIHLASPADFPAGHIQLPLPSDGDVAGECQRYNPALGNPVLCHSHPSAISSTRAARRLIATAMLKVPRSSRRPAIHSRVSVLPPEVVAAVS